MALAALDADSASRHCKRTMTSADGPSPYLANRDCRTGKFAPAYLSRHLAVTGFCEPYHSATTTFVLKYLRWHKEF